MAAPSARSFSFPQFAEVAEVPEAHLQELRIVDLLRTPEFIFSDLRLSH
jgi:hypothetical protein